MHTVMVISYAWTPSLQSVIYHSVKDLLPTALVLKVGMWCPAPVYVLCGLSE